MRELRASGELNEAIFGAASLAQPEEPPDEDDEQARELADKEAEYQKNPPVTIDPDEDLPVR